MRPAPLSKTPAIYPIFKAGKAARPRFDYRDLDRLPPELEQGAIYHDNDEDFLRTIDVLSMHVPGRIVRAPANGKAGRPPSSWA